jgi:branched-chain amino acid transport system permease protein
MLSLGLAVIFGLLGVVNFAHGAFYMLGAYATWIILDVFELGYWWALVLAPISVGLIGMLLERLFLQFLYKIDPLYGLLLTFGLSLIAEGVLREVFGSSGQTYPVPELLQGAIDVGFMNLPIYRVWVIVASLSICFITWYVIERTRLGSTLRAATENPKLVQAFGINVPVMVMFTYAGGVALAALAGVLSAPVIQVSPLMGSSLVIVVFAVVVIGGMGSIMGSILSGVGLGVIEGFTKVLYPEASNIVVFLIMAIVLCWRPAGLFGKE